jgi:hypothetical protein
LTSGPKPKPDSRPTWVSLLVIATLAGGALATGFPGRPTSPAGAQYGRVPGRVDPGSAGLSAGRAFDVGAQQETTTDGEGTRPFARVAGITLSLPARHAVGVGYHEASFPEAKPLVPLGRCARNANRTKFSPPDPSSGPMYVVMASRGRGQPATSAVDVAMGRGSTVLSPVTGRVWRVERYRLYGSYPDVRLTLIASTNPRLKVVMLHVTSPLVHPRALVVAGVTPLGTVRPLPFRSQVNDYLGPGIPHVHIEVKALGSPRHR